MERYFDNAATTPLDPRVLAEMIPFLSEDFGNASSLHGYGMRARAAVDLARQRVAELIGADDPSQVVFTSGATESNNWVLNSASRPERVFVSPFEHSAVREPALARGFGTLPHEEYQLSVVRDAELVSVMSVNNEIGARWDPVQFRSGTEKLHSDMTQQIGKLPAQVEDLDYASFSAHKFYGPKGIGALYIASDPPDPFMLGGEQEEGRRAGTLNLPGIVGMGAAAAIAMEKMEEDQARAESLRFLVLSELLGKGEITTQKLNESNFFST